MILPYLIEKEFKQMMRNIILPIVFIVLPIGMINLMPRAATQEVKNLTISVIDNDHSTWSQRLIQKLSASTSFSLTDVSSTYDAALHRVEAGEADFIVEIEPDFERNLVREGVSRVLISANAVNGVKAGLGSSYLSQIITDYATELREEQGAVASAVSQPGLTVAPRYLYNATLDYKCFMIPGLIAMLLVLIVGFLPALNIVGEKERGTIEQINVTPIGRFVFIFSKLIPYWAVGLFILSYSVDSVDLRLCACGQYRVDLSVRHALYSYRVESGVDCLQLFRYGSASRLGDVLLSGHLHPIEWFADSHLQYAEVGTNHHLSESPPLFH